MNDIFEQLQKIGIESAQPKYEDAKKEGWLTVADVAEISGKDQTTVRHLLKRSVDAGKWERQKVKMNTGSVAYAYRGLASD